MRIVFVIPHLMDGGAERGVVTFANALACMGEDVCIAYTKNQRIDYTVDPKVQTIYVNCDSRVNIPKIRGLCNTYMFFSKLREHPGDVYISVNFSMSLTWWIWTLTHFSGAGMVYTVLNNVEKKYIEKKPRKQYERACRMADAIWIQTEDQRKFLPSYAQEKVFVLRNILDEKFLKAPKTYRGEIRRFISVGRLHPQKNQEMLVEAFTEMIRRTGNDTATLTIYGQEVEGVFEIEKKLRELIRKYRLEERVFLPGRKREIEKCYEEADAFVFGSDYEGLPNALMEAMASGLPCISTDCPTGPSDLITSGENGILVPVGDAEAMSQAMEAMIRRPRQAEEMGKRARQTMENWGSEEELAGQLLEHLRRIRSGSRIRRKG